MNTHDFTNHLAHLLRIERGAAADFLVALADFDRERRWVELGYTSLFDFLHRKLGLSRGAAHYRKTAAELVQKFPDIVEPLRDGRLCITTIIELAKVLTPDNKADVLPRFFRLSKQEAMAVAAAIRPVENAPRRDVLAPVRPLTPERARHSSGAPPLLGLAALAAEASSPVQPVELAPSSEAPIPADRPDAPVQPVELGFVARPESRDSVQPLDGRRFRLRMTVSDRFVDKLHAAEDALSHAIPDGSWEAILERGLDLALAQAAKRKGLVEKPRNTPAPAAPDSDHVPAHVRREVWERDGGCCQWPLEGGGVCGSTWQCELDHVDAKARGGKATAENLRVLCRFHNQLHARRTFGDACVDRYAGAAARARRRKASASA